MRHAGPCRAVRKHQALQQRVGGQAVGAMQARAGHLRRVRARQQRCTHVWVPKVTYGRACAAVVRQARQPLQLPRGPCSRGPAATGVLAALQAHGKHVHLRCGSMAYSWPRQPACMRPNTRWEAELAVQAELQQQAWRVPRVAQRLGMAARGAKRKRSARTSPHAYRPCTLVSPSKPVTTPPQV